MITRDTAAIYTQPVLLTDAELEHAINRMFEDIRDGELYGIATLEARAWLAVALRVQRDRAERRVITEPEPLEIARPGWLYAAMLPMVIGVSGFIAGSLEVGGIGVMLACVSVAIWVLRNDQARTTA